jgi:uncharacterized protein YkwD
MNLFRTPLKFLTIVNLAIWLAISLAASSCLPVTPWQQPPVYRRLPPPIRGIYFLVEVEGEVLRLTNEARRQQALPPLAGDQALTGAARQHSGDMLARGFFSHVNPDGLSAAQRFPQGYAQVLMHSGENIWMGSGQNTHDPFYLARNIMTTLLASPGHRQNLLDPGYTNMGVGVAAWGQEVRTTQIFGQFPGGLPNR